MREQKAAFFREVLSKTRAGRIRWHPTASESAFCAVIPGGYALGLAADDAGGTKQIALALNEFDRPLLTVIGGSDVVSQREMDELFKLVQTKIDEADSKVETAIEALANL
jgi:hypothetical protein